MSDKHKSASKIPEAKVVPRKRTRFSLVWIIPMVAAAAGVWIAVTNILNRGPEISIVFKSADGIEAQKTKIVYNGLDIGTITSLKLSDNRRNVIATASMSPSVKDLLVKDTKFWVVQPRVTGMAITGLSTLISGNYVGMQLGQSDQKSLSFVALDNPPLTGDVPGRVYTLKTPVLGSLGAGTPVFYRQLQVGQVVSYSLDRNGKGLSVKIFVNAPYDRYVNSNTRFWQASGIDISMSANGVQLKTESLMSILAGGVAFENPPGAKEREPAGNGAEFALYTDRGKAFSPPVCDPHFYMLVFKQSVRGLNVGAPVEFYGLKIGEVVDIIQEVNVKKMEVTVNVKISMDPRRYGVKFLDLPLGEDKVTAHKKLIEGMVKHGFRARLNTGNLLTGALLVSLDYVPDASTVKLDWSQSPLRLPTVPSGIDSIEDRVASLLKNLNQAVVEARGTIKKADKVMGSANKMMGSADKMMNSAEKMMNNGDKLINNANLLIEPNSVMNTELNNMLRQGNDAARALRILANYLERHPEAIIYGKKGEAK